MGQSSSSPRNGEEPNHDHRRFSQILQGREAGHAQTLGSHERYSIQRPAPSVNASPLPASNPHPSQPLATFSRQISAQSIPVLRSGSGVHRDVTTRDEIFYEQHEERPLVHMEDLGMRDAPITYITASPMPRRSSRIARLSSMMVPRYATTGSAGEDQTAQGEGRFLRRRLSNSPSSGATDIGRASNSHRTSFFSSISPRMSTISRPRQRRELANISRPYPLNADATSPPSNFATTSLGGNLSDATPRTLPHSRPSRFWSFRDGSRLSRVRQSISLPFENLLPSTGSTSTEDRGTQTPPRRPSRVSPGQDSDFLVTPIGVSEPNITTVNSRVEAPSFIRTGQRLSGISTVSESPERALSRADGPSWAERWTDRGSTTRRESRRMPGMLRGRSSRLIRRDNDGPLPRILHLAATAIAAQLSGTVEQSAPDMQPLGPDDLDVSLQNLFRTLQNASNLGGEHRNHDENNDPSRPPGVSPPLNFLRVFRFVSQSQHNERTGGRTSNADQSAVEATSEDPEGRTVTLVVVGVRSVPAETTTPEDASAPEPNLDSLLNLPPLAPTTNRLRHGASGLLRQANGRARTFHRRRASIGGFSTFPANYDSQRHQRALSSSSGNDSADPTFTSNPISPLILQDSPPGPHPPPSTPAEPGLSTHSSATTTPSRRPSSVSAIHQPPMPSRDATSQHMVEASVSQSEQQATAVQQRRRSDSEFARHRDLGAGAARRNGVVEPDELETTDSPTSGSRSWLIYVVGTNLSEDHPALTTPSLFTDSPTYEDMLLLSSLLGPARPPVASREDVASASGTYRLESSGDLLIAVANQGLGQLSITPKERCLVCLEEYQIEEELRQLTKCSHLFHRECIDQWLTTGRNSCPLCRGQGVDEQKEVPPESHIDPVQSSATGPTD